MEWISIFESLPDDFKKVQVTYQGGRSVNLRHGGESFRERGQGQ